MYAKHKQQRQSLRSMYALQLSLVGFLFSKTVVNSNEEPEGLPALP